MHIKVGIIGPESTAKSTLSQQLAEAFAGTYIPEYAREYISNLTRPYTYADVENIARHQIQQLQVTPAASSSLSDSVTSLHQSDATQIFPPAGGTRGGLQSSPLWGGQEGGCLFFDTELIITKVWFLHKYGTCPNFLIDALKENPIDFYLLCAPDLPFEPDPLRENPHLRNYLFDWYEQEIQAQSKPYAIIRGEGLARLQSAIQALHSYLSTHK